LLGDTIVKMKASQLRKIIKEELDKFLAEMSKEEEKFFGDEIKALVDNPDELYYVKNVKPRNPYVDLEERQFLNRRWIEENVGKYLGGGSFRDAYQIRSHPDKILKISNRYLQHDPLDGQEYTTIAEDTNALEIEMFNKYPGYFPKVYISDKEKQGIPRWLVIEKVEVIEYRSEFIIILSTISLQNTCRAHRQTFLQLLVLVVKSTQSNGHILRGLLLGTMNLKD